MQADLWKAGLLQEIVFHFGNDSEFIEEIFSCHHSKISKKQFSLHECLDISARLGVSLESLIKREIDWKAVKNKFVNPSYSLPDEYTTFSGTHMNTIRSVISFIGFKYNQETAQGILQELQLSREALLNDDVMVNVNLVNKLFGLLVDKIGFTAADINLMSAIVHRFSMRNSVLSMAKSCKNDGDVIRLMVANSVRYELNFDYWFEDLGDKYIIHSQSRQELHDRLNISEAMTDPVLSFKLSTIRNMTLLMGRNPMRISSHQNVIENGLQRIKILVHESRKSSSLPSFIM